MLADIVGGSNLEMIVGDMAGNLVCVSADADILWDVQVHMFTNNFTLQSSLLPCTQK